jgi:hypothetical protein
VCLVYSPLQHLEIVRAHPDVDLHISLADQVPVPDRATFCGLPPPSSLIDTSAVRLPFTNGLNVTLIKQLAPEATLVPHVLVSAKSRASVLVIAILVIFTAELPLFVSVIFLARLLVPSD